MKKSIVFAALTLFAVPLFAADSSSSAQDPAAYWDPDAASQRGKGGHYVAVCTGLPAAVWNAVAPALGGAQTPGKLMHRWGSDAEGKPHEAHPKEPVGYTVFAPKDIAPGEELGVIVYIPPDQAAPTGVMQHPFQSFVEARRVVTVALNRAGNADSVPWRIACAVNAVQVARRRYAVDPERVYVTGVSGGGRATSYVMMRYPDLFKGAAPIIGCNSPQLWMQAAHLPASCLQQFKQTTRLAILEGSKDFNRAESKGIYDTLRRGMRYIAYIEQPELAHACPGATYLAQAMDHLDGPMRAAAPARWKRVKDQLADHKKDGQSLDELNKLACAMAGNPWEEEAKAAHKALIAAYKEAKDAAAKAVAEGDAKEAAKAVEAFAKAWTPASKRDEAQLKADLKAVKK